MGDITSPPESWVVIRPPVQRILGRVGQQRLHTRSIALLAMLTIGLIVVVIYAGSCLIR